MNVLWVSVPKGHVAGQQFAVQAPSGQQLLVTVPAGAAAGEQIQVSAPPSPPVMASAVPVQAPQPVQSADVGLQMGEPVQQGNGKIVVAYAPADGCLSCLVSCCCCLTCFRSVINPQKDHGAKFKVVVNGMEKGILSQGQTASWAVVANQQVQVECKSVGVAAWFKKHFSSDLVGSHVASVGVGEEARFRIDFRNNDTCCGRHEDTPRFTPASNV